MRKTIFFIALFLIISVIGISIGVYVANLENTSDTEFEYITQMSGTKVTDECVEEGQELLETNARENKISPNAILIMKRYYPECGHTTTHYIDVPEDIVNLGENEFKQKYEDWAIEGFSNNEIVMSKEEIGICNEHYVLEVEDGRIVVYSIDKNNHKKIHERTGILSQYLTSTDLINLENGIRINGKESLNKLLEDFE